MRGQRLIVDADQLQRLHGRIQINGGDPGDGLADVTHPVQGQIGLIPQKNPEAHRVILPGRNGAHAPQAFRPRGIDVQDFRMRVPAPEVLACQHARQREVGPVHGLARGLQKPVHVGLVRPDHGQISVFIHSEIPEGLGCVSYG